MGIDRVEVRIDDGAWQPAIIVGPAATGLSSRGVSMRDDILIGARSL